MLDQAWRDAVASPVLVPALLTLLSTVVVAWLNSRGAWRKQESEEAQQLRAEQREIRDELRTDLGSVRTRLDASEKARLTLAENRLADRQKIIELENALTTTRGLVKTLQQMVGDRRSDPARVEASAIEVETLHAERLEVHRPVDPEGA